MRRVFGDTFYWIALLNPRDDWHKTVINYAYNHGVIDEILAYASSKVQSNATKSAPFV